MDVELRAVPYTQMPITCPSPVRDHPNPHPRRLLEVHATRSNKHPLERHMSSAQSGAALCCGRSKRSKCEPTLRWPSCSSTPQHSQRSLRVTCGTFKEMYKSEADPAEFCTKLGASVGPLPACRIVFCQPIGPICLQNMGLAPS